MNKNITIKVVLWSRKDKNKLFPVKIRITEDRKSSYINLGFSVEKRFWLKSTDRISTSHPNFLEYNFIIEKKLKELDKLDKQNIKKIGGKLNVFSDLENKINNDFQNQYYSKKKFRTLYYHLKKYWGNLDLHYYDIDKEFYIGFRNYLQLNIKSRDTISNNPSNNTIVGYLKFLTTFLNEKKQEGVYVGDLEFVKKVSPKKIPTKIQPLTTDDIWVLDNLLPSHEFMRPLLFDSINTFLFNFWSNGLRIGDCIRLKWGNIQGDVIVVRMGKTKRILTIPLTEKNIWRIFWYMKNFPKIYDWKKGNWYDGNYEDWLYSMTNIDKLGDDFSLINFEEYLNLLMEYEEYKDNLIDNVNYFLKDDNFHIRGGRYSVEFNNFVKLKTKEKSIDPFGYEFPFELFKEKKEILIKSLIHSIKIYSQDERVKNDFIFPFLKGYENEKDITRLSNKVSSSVSLINKSLKEIGKEVGITKKLTNHLSRHSITSISKSLGTDVYDLKDMLGHTNVKQTETYINSINTIETSKRNTDKLTSLLDNLND
jgi:integrase